MGVRLAVGQRTLDPYAEVQILDPQPEMTCPLCVYAGGAKLLGDPCEVGKVDASSIAGIVSIVIQLISKMIWIGNSVVTLFNYTFTI